MRRRSSIRPRMLNGRRRIGNAGAASSSRPRAPARPRRSTGARDPPRARAAASLGRSAVLASSRSLESPRESLGISSARIDESKRHDRFESPTSPAVAERLDDHRWDAGVELDVTRLTFPGARRQVRPYLGIGAFGSFRYSRERFRERLEPTGSGPPELRGEDRGTSWGVGLFGAFGVEWRVRSNVALH